MTAIVGLLLSLLSGSDSEGESALIAWFLEIQAEVFWLGLVIRFGGFLSMVWVSTHCKRRRVIGGQM
jgi:hypothetical protein